MYHGKSATRLYAVWGNMKERCYNPNHPSYKYYGARGIVMCKEWKNDFSAFYAWAVQTGYDESAPRGRCTIERKDNDGPYSPDNCRWATMAEQDSNKRTNIKIPVGGEVKSLKQVCREQGLVYANERMAYHRRKQGVRLMSEYIEDRKKKVDENAKKLRKIIEQNPSWTNAKISETMGLSVRQIQRLKKMI